jgi:hypothetical protein
MAGRRHYERVRDVVGYLRARLAELADEACDYHRRSCPAAGDSGADCECGYPQQLLADLAGRRELIDEFVHWLESEYTSYRGRARTHHALLVMAQPWAGRSDFDPYWRVDV